MSLPGRIRRLTRAFAYAFVTSAVIGALAVVAGEKVHAVLDVDKDVIRAATDFTRARPGFRGFLLQSQYALQPIRVYMVAGAVCLWMWRVKHFTTRAWWAFGTMMIGWFVALQIKLVVQRDRPVVHDPVSHAPGYSFPSGHAANATLASAVLVVLLWPVLRTRLARVVAVVAASVITLGTACDRVLLGVHYPSDVLAGIIFGVGLTASSYAGYIDWHPEKEN